MVGTSTKSNLVVLALNEVEIPTYGTDVLAHVTLEFLNFFDGVLGAAPRGKITSILFTTMI